jgi:hypothetical protein
MSYEHAYPAAEPRTLADRWRALSTPWKVAVCAAGLLVLVSWLDDDAPGGLPTGLEVGATLAGLQVVGEKALYHEDGIEVTDIAGRWIEVRLGADEATRRWFQLDHLAGLKLR